ncbi:MAG: type II toxin-antitoxin system RelE/ParE family toxin [Parachlamydiaceae bacterium]|nr:MAG: type II toxin-antitoxin system RelE/ParE family toxin [Parachlamydiaceae bacterium]
MTHKIYTLPEYEDWFQKQSEKSKLQIEKRLDRIKDEDHFGHIRNLGDGLVELKFNDGRRIYYTIIPVNNVILLLGGGKMVKTVTSGRRKIGSRRQKKTPKKSPIFIWQILMELVKNISL